MYGRDRRRAVWWRMERGGLRLGEEEECKVGRGRGVHGRERKRAVWWRNG